MAEAGAYVLKGLLEPLVLLAIERSPTHGYGILKDFEDILGEAPNKNQVYPLLRSLEDDGLITSEEVDDDQRPKLVYHITPEGRGRLDEFRTLSAGFKHRIVDLFAIPPPDQLAAELREAGRLEELEHMEAPPRRPPDREAAPQAPPVRVEGGWVADHLQGLPAGPPVRAPYARFSLDREPGTDTWTLTVERHRPGGYEGSEICPLTFLYLAVQRLLFQAPGEE